MDFTAYEVDAFSFDCSGSEVLIAQTWGGPGIVMKQILALPIADLRADSLDKQPRVTDLAHIADHPTSKYPKASISRPYQPLPWSREVNNVPLPFTDLSTSDGGRTAAYVFDGDFYVWELPKGAKDSDAWEWRCKIPTTMTNNFVCYRAGNSLRILGADGLRYEIAEVEPRVERTIESLVTRGGGAYKLVDQKFIPIDAAGRPLPEAAGSQPAATQPRQAVMAALVMDRTAEPPTAYRLLWHDGALHPEATDHDKSHEQVAVAASKAVEVLATSPAVGICERYLEDRIKAEKAAIEKEQIDPALPK